MKIFNINLILPWLKRLLRLTKAPEQWSKEERSYLEKVAKAPLKINMLPKGLFSLKERKMMKKTEKAYVKLMKNISKPNPLLESTNGEVTKNKYGVKRVEEIVKEISETVIYNTTFIKWSKKFKRSKKGRLLMLRNPKGFYRTSVVYNGRESWAAFYDLKQTEEITRKLAWHIYKKELPSFKKKEVKRKDGSRKRNEEINEGRDN